MSRSTKIGMILAAIGQSVIYTFGVMGVLRLTLHLFGMRMPQPLGGCLFLFTVALISALSVTMCVKQINRAKSLPEPIPTLSE